MPEAFKGCLVSIAILSDAALADRIPTVANLLEAIRREERTAIGAYRCALSAVANFLSLLEDQAINERAIREYQEDLERCRQILAGVVSPSQENDKDSERRYDRDRLLKKIEDTEKLIHLRRSARDAVEGQLSALSAIHIDSYLDVVGVPAHDPLRLSLNSQGNDVSKATESPREPSLAQSFKEFAAKTVIDLAAKHPRGVPQTDLKPFAAECDARSYLLNPDFLRPRVCKAIKQYNDDHPRAMIKNYSDLVAVLSPVAVGSGPAKKRMKDSRQVVSRQFRVWLSENKSDYLEKQKKAPK